LRSPEHMKRRPAPAGSGGSSTSPASASARWCRPRHSSAASDIFKVPAVYAVYCGDPAYRAGGRMCARAHRRDPCQRCERASVLLFPALAGQERLDAAPSKAGETAFTTSVPLEDTIDPAVPAPAVNHAFRFARGDGFADLLDNPQTGARDIAKTMLGMVREVREQMLVKFQKDRIDLGPNAVFRSVFARGEQPGDHLLPYAHILRGLRRQLPQYVDGAPSGHRRPAGRRRISGCSSPLSRRVGLSGVVGGCGGWSCRRGWWRGWTRRAGARTSSRGGARRCHGGSCTAGRSR
jgi:hypothetical protein